jgi:hypothetical protein
LSRFPEEAAFFSIVKLTKTILFNHGNHLPMGRSLLELRQLNASHGQASSGFDW